MKHLALIFGVILLSTGISSGKDLQAHLSYATFYSPERGPYVETYMSINPNTIHYQQTENGQYQGAVEITMMFKQGDNISAFDKYVLNSPLLNDTTDIKEQFLDLKRFSLPKGKYSFNLIISDKNSNKEPYIVSETVSLNYDNQNIQFSDIQMVDNYSKSEKQNILTKSGYDLVPYPSNFYPENKEDFIFYSELYNTEKVLGKDSRFLLKYFLESAHTHQPLEDYVKIRRMDARSVHTIFHKFDISEIPSGNYQLVLQVYNEENELIADKRSFIQRSNPKVSVQNLQLAEVNVDDSFVAQLRDKEELIDYIQALRPIATPNEEAFIDNHLASLDIGTLQKFFYHFWHERNTMAPEQVWDAYHKNLVKVNNEYKTMVKNGYETDRGEIYLKYGAPNAIIQSFNEPNAYPFEIWQYYETERHRDSKFVFYTHDLVTNDFDLIHSNVPGEVKNRKWQMMVFGRNVEGSDVDVQRYPDLWGSKQEYYENPF